MARVREGLLKDTLKKATATANAKGLAEGSQEALGDGMMLDLTAKFLYDDERNLISREALSQRGMEFIIGYGVGALVVLLLTLCRVELLVKPSQKHYKDMKQR